MGRAGGRRGSGSVWCSCRVWVCGVAGGGPAAPGCPARAELLPLPPKVHFASLWCLSKCHVWRQPLAGPCAARGRGCPGSRAHGGGDAGRREGQPEPGWGHLECGDTGCVAVVAPCRSWRQPLATPPRSLCAPCVPVSVLCVLINPFGREGCRSGLAGAGGATVLAGTGGAGGPGCGHGPCTPPVTGPAAPGAPTHSCALTDRQTDLCVSVHVDICCDFYTGAYTHTYMYLYLHTCIYVYTSTHICRCANTCQYT